MLTLSFLVVLSPRPLNMFSFNQTTAKFHSDRTGKALRQEINELEIVICPVFDGCGPNQMHESIREWLSGDMPGVLKPFPDGTASARVH
jgi:hypothetical protein